MASKKVRTPAELAKTSGGSFVNYGGERLQFSRQGTQATLRRYKDAGRGGKSDWETVHTFDDSPDDVPPPPPPKPPPEPPPPKPPPEPPPPKPPPVPPPLEKGTGGAEGGAGGTITPPPVREAPSIQGLMQDSAAPTGFRPSGDPSMNPYLGRRSPGSMAALLRRGNY